MIKRISALIVALLLLVSGFPTVSALLFPPALSEGSVKIFMEWESERLDGGALSAYRVCDIVKTADDYEIKPVSELEKYNIDLQNMSEFELAEQFAQAAKAEKLRRFTAPIENGEAFFGNLPMGLYVITQSTGEETSGFEAISPFLILVPIFTDDGYDLHVEAEPKVSPAPDETLPPETNPTDPSDPTDPDDPTKPTTPTTPPKPNDPNLPQSGQLNWPVPVLAGSGLLMIVIGLLILSGRRKDSYEK